MSDLMSAWFQPQASPPRPWWRSRWRDVRWKNLEATPSRKRFGTLRVTGNNCENSEEKKSGYGGQKTMFTTETRSHGEKLGGRAKSKAKSKTENGRGNRGTLEN